MKCSTQLFQTFAKIIKLTLCTQRRKIITVRLSSVCYSMLHAMICRIFHLILILLRVRLRLHVECSCLGFMQNYSWSGVTCISSWVSIFKLPSEAPGRVYQFHTRWVGTFYFLLLFFLLGDALLKFIFRFINDLWNIKYQARSLFLN